MTFRINQNPHDDERINYLNSYFFGLEEVARKLLEEVPCNNLQETEEYKGNDPFDLVAQIEKEMGFSFMDIVMSVGFATIATDKIRCRILRETELSKVETPMVLDQPFLDAFQGLTEATKVQSVSEFPLDPELKGYGIIYLVGNQQNNVVRIGFTTRLLQARIKTLQRDCPYKLEAIAKKVGTFEDKQKLLHNFQHIRLEGEWFEWDDSIIEAFQ